MYDVMEREFAATLKRFSKENSVDKLELYMPFFQCPLSSAYIQLMIHLFNKENQRASLNASMLLSTLILKFPHFEKFSQHDSLDALRFLLAGLRQEELRRWQRAILTKFKVDPQYTQVSELEKMEVRSWGKATGLSTTVDRVFGGIILNSLTCSTCKSIDQSFEIFSDLSLHLFELYVDQDNTDIETVSDEPETKRTRKPKHYMRRRLNESGRKKKTIESNVACNSSRSPSVCSLDYASDVEDNADDGIMDGFESPDVPAGNLAKKLITPIIYHAGQAVHTDEISAQEISLRTLVSPRPIWGTDLEQCLARHTSAQPLPSQTACYSCTKRKFGANPPDGELVCCGMLKQVLIIHPPAVLILHLKRFPQAGNRFAKCSKKISFPITLDMSPFCSRLSKPLPNGRKVTYRLFGVVEHSGNVQHGHYLSYVALEPDDLTQRRHLPNLHFLSPIDKPDTWPMTLQHLVFQMRRGKKEVIFGENRDDSCDLDVPNRMEDSRIWYRCDDKHVSPVSLSELLKAQPYMLFYERIA